jgi:nucleoside-diphosphate-sugar epimerase
MRVGITGGSGKLGQACIRELLEHDYEVVNFDSALPAETLCPTVRLELTDYGQVVDALCGTEDRYPSLDAVVHLAAIPAPGLRTNAATFHNNIACSYNVFNGARVAGIKNVVWASSETVLGLPFDEAPPYIPVDEACTRPESTYSLVKLLEEEMAQQFCRWDKELKMLGLRFSNVLDARDYARFGEFQDDPWTRKWNLWGYIDSRDGAQAVRRALEHKAIGTDVFVIASPDTVMHTPNAELLEAVFPDVPLTRPVAPHETLLSIDKAKRVLGYAPKYSWRSEV